MAVKHTKYNCNFQWLFAVMDELRQMRERISLIEAKLARSKQAADHPSSEQLSAVVRTTDDSMADQSCVSRTENVVQNSSQNNLSVLRPLSTHDSSCSGRSSSVSVQKAQVSTKTGIIISRLFVYEVYNS